jgi:hypothetical protein
MPMTQSPRLSKAELIEAAYEITGGNVKDLSYERLCRLMTVTQFVTDLCLNEIERRDELTCDHANGRVIIPYMCEHQILTMLTGRRRPGLTQVRSYWRSIPQVLSDQFNQLMSKAELLSAAADMLGGAAKDQSSTHLLHRMTVAQFVTDLCLNEIDDRDALQVSNGAAEIPYHCEYWVETVLTRRGRRWR